MKTAEERLEQWIFRGILFAVIILGTGYNIVTPPWQFPDEFGHHDYIHFVQFHHRLPSYQFPTDSWEYHQPPLYYISEAIATWPFSGHHVLVQMFVERVFSLLIGLVSIVAARKFLQFLFPRQPWQVAWGTAFFALLPMNLYMSSGINNDVVANLFGVLILLSLLHLVRRAAIGNREIFLLGLTLGGSLLTKITIYPLSFVVFMVAGVVMIRRGERSVARWALLVAPIFLLSGSWWLWNMVEVGHPLGWSKIAAFGELMRRENWLNLSGIWDWISTWSRSTIGLFDYGNIAIAFKQGYWLFGLLFFVALVGQGWAWKDATRTQRRWFALLDGFVILAVGEVFYYSLSVYQPQGRYGLVALLGLVVFVTIGWWSFIRGRPAIIRWGAVLGLISFLLFIHLYQLQMMHRIYRARVPAQVQLDQEYTHNKWINPQKMTMLPSSDGFRFDLRVGSRTAKSAFSKNRFYTDEIEKIHVTLHAPQSGRFCVTWRATFEREFGYHPKWCKMIPKGTSTIEFEWEKPPTPIILGEVQLQFPPNWEWVELKSVWIDIDPELYWQFREPRWN
jgi:hypothetical protein